ncbi:putative MFS multidrug transporter [Aspergillus affinis]|uniref:putative MFS multidrug transporter n=1 Tax=Aspergillus affinis TaxID=1070780 RepID=UPI0022FE71D5|nr:vesicular amine transporter [Aspergillus affinis]KAI9037141.1 vesicular amine transporter [Aspergillus affinis]
MSTPPPLTPPSRLIAIRPENIAAEDFTLSVHNRPEPWHPLDYTVSYNGSTIFTVFGHPFTIGQRRTFYDRSGLPLFDLRCRWYTSSILDLKLPGGENNLLAAKLRVAVREPKATITFQNAVAGDLSSSSSRRSSKLPMTDQVTMEVHAQDLDNMVQVVVVENRNVASIHRITDPEQLTEGQMPPFRLRPKWDVRIAQGVDISLIAVVVVILGQNAGDIAYNTQSLSATPTERSPIDACNDETGSLDPACSLNFDHAPGDTASPLTISQHDDRPGCHVFLYTFLVPILPYVLENRLGIDPSLTQRLSFALLAESSVIALVCSPFIGNYADTLPSKKAVLLASLAVVLLGSIVLAAATSAAVLFIGRLIQAIASSFIWVVGYATIADNVQPENLGKTYGFVSVVVGAGTSGGPIIAGVLFELGGYWLAWSSAFVIIFFDIIFRLLMLERPRSITDDENPENDPLLSGTGGDSAVEEKTGLQFYLYMFRHRKFVCGALSYLTFAILTTSFDTTLPLHVRDVFGWKSMLAGLMFFAFQGPGIVLSPLCGWLKDRVGTRWPTTVGFIGVAPVMWLLGTPGDDRFPWINEGNRGQVIYTVAMTGVGILTCLLNGAGTIEATGTFDCVCALKSVLLTYVFSALVTVDEIEARHPGIFGPHGGYSRALSIASMSWTLGSFVGPILSGWLAERFGYYEMNCALGMILSI